MIVAGSVLIPRNQRSIKQKHAKMHNACAFGAFSHIMDYCSVTVTRIKFYFFALIPWYQDTSDNHHEPSLRLKTLTRL